MVETEFKFDSIKGEEVEKYFNEAKVFNCSVDELCTYVVEDDGFESELGNSVQVVTVFIKRFDLWGKKEKFFEINKEDYNKTKNLKLVMGDYIAGSVRGALIITRIMSNFIFDKKSGSSNAVYFNICSDMVWDKIKQNFPLQGKLCKERVFLNDENYINYVKE